MSNKKRLVIVGGGLAGLPLAKTIEDNKKLAALFDVTLIDKKSFYELTPAAPRFLVSPNNFESFSNPYTYYLKKTRIVTGTVRNVQSQPQQVEVITAAGTEFIVYDYLVYALGTRYQQFKSEVVTQAERKGEVEQISHQIAQAQKILVVGGRSVGVEIAAEILEVYPSKNITIVHPLDSLMDGWPKGGIKKVSKHLAKGPNFKVVLGKKVVRTVEDNRHELSDGTFIEADLKIFAAGVTPNSEPLREFLADALSPAGYLKVGKSLQVDGHDNIFGLGDIADLDHPKMAANLKPQLELVIKNLQVLATGKGKMGTIGGPKMTYPGLLGMGPSYHYCVALCEVEIPLIERRFGVLAVPAFGGSSASGKFLSSMKTNLFLKFSKNGVY